METTIESMAYSLDSDRQQVFLFWYLNIGSEESEEMKKRKDLKSNPLEICLKMFWKQLITRTERSHNRTARNRCIATLRNGSNIFWLWIYGRGFPEHYNHNLNDSQEIRRVGRPVAQIWQIYTTRRVHMFWHFDCHVFSRRYVTNGSAIGVGVGYPYWHWDVINSSSIGHRYCALQTDQVLLIAVWKHILLYNWIQVLVIIDRRLNVSFALILISILNKQILNFSHFLTFHTKTHTFAVARSLTTSCGLISIDSQFI